MKKERTRDQPRPVGMRWITESHIGPIVRDVIIIWVLTWIGGFIAGLAARDTQQDAPPDLFPAMVSNLLLGTVGFTIAGLLAPRKRWRHLCFVALGSWLTSLINVACFGVSIFEWMAGVVLLVIVMGVGGLISTALNKSRGIDSEKDRGRRPSKTRRASSGSVRKPHKADFFPKRKVDWANCRPKGSGLSFLRFEISWRRRHNWNRNVNELNRDPSHAL